MSEMKINSARLKRLMDKRGVSDGDLAEAVGKGRTTIYYLRVGKNKTTSEATLRLIADYLQTTMEYLTEESEADLDDGRVPVLLPERPRRLAEIAVKLSGLRQEELLRIAATFEKMEAEELRQPVSTEMMRDLLKQVADLGPHASVANLIQVLRSIMGNQSGSGFIDLGGPGESGPEQPGQGQ